MDSIQKVVDDQRSLGALAAGTARRTSSTSALTQQDFDVATRLGPNAGTGRTDQGTDAPKAARNPWNPAADRTSTNPYDHVIDALRTSALKRDAALAGTSSTSTTTSAVDDNAIRASQDAEATLSGNPYGEAYVRSAIAAYQRNSGLGESSTVAPRASAADPALASSGAAATDNPSLASSDPVAQTDPALAETKPLPVEKPDTPRERLGGLLETA